MDWISVKDSPPPPLEWVLILCSLCSNEGAGCFCEKTWIFDEEYKCFHSPTGWKQPDWESGKRIWISRSEAEKMLPNN